MLDLDPASPRAATAAGQIRLAPDLVDLVISGKAPYSDAIATARIAGVLAAKRTGDLLPFHRPLALARIAVEIGPLDDNAGLAIAATVEAYGSGDCELEALTAVSIAALALYDAVKAADRRAVIDRIKLVSADGERSVAQEGESEPASAQSKTKPKLVSRGFRRSPGAAVARARTLDAATPAGAAALSRVEACRRFMRDNKLQVTAWASLAGLPPGLVYGFLHGRVGRLPKDSEERLARAANATVADIFGSA